MVFEMERERLRRGRGRDQGDESMIREIKVLVNDIRHWKPLSIVLMARGQCERGKCLV